MVSQPMLTASVVKRAAAVLTLAAALTINGQEQGGATSIAHADVRTQAHSCNFVLGFDDLRDAVGAATVGDCLEDQHFASNGDAHQQTTGGLLAWIKTDNRTIFTDGFRTWAAGLDGLQISFNQNDPTDGASAALLPASAPAAPPPTPAAPPPPSSAWMQVSADLPAISTLDPAPHYPADNRIFRVNSQLVQVSTTQGRAWEQVGTRSSCARPPYTYAFASVQLSPTFRTDNTMVAFASAGWGPLSITSDGGQTWNCLPQRFVQSYRNATTMFSPTFVQDHRLWVRGTVNGNSSIEASADAGQTWNTLALPLNLAPVTTFSVSGSATGQATLLLGENDSTRTPSSRYFRSSDLGKTWQEITEAFRDPVTLQLPSLTFQSGVDVDRVYASPSSRQIPTATWYSKDAGATWQVVSARRVEGVTPDGCGVLTDTTSMELSCSGVSAAVASLPPDASPHVLSVTNFADHGTVLVGASHGLWTYQFRP